MIYASKMTRLQEDHAGASVRHSFTYARSDYIFILHRYRPFGMSLGDYSRHMKGRALQRIE